MNITKTETTVEQFISLILQGIQAWEQAGQIYVELLDRDPTVKRKIIESTAWLTGHQLNAFERIGRKQLRPELLVAEFPGLVELRKAAYSDQVKYLKEPIEVIVWENGKTDVLLLPPHSLTKRQAKQVFHQGTMRTPTEQKAWLTSQSPKPQNIAGLKKPYSVRGDRLTINQPCSFTRQQLAIILSEM